MISFGDFFLGKSTGHSSGERKRALLTTFYMLVWAVVVSYYIISNLILKRHSFLTPYYIFTIVLLICFWLNRTGRYSLSKSLLLLSGNLLVFTYCTLKPPVPGPFNFFIGNCLMSLSVFGWEERGKSFFFVGLSFVLILVARYSDFTLVPPTHLTPEYIQQNFFNNLLVVCVISILVVYFLVQVNHNVETSLREQEIKTQEQNKQLIKTNQELDRFIYSTSHDLRAPISSVMGLIHLCELTTDPEELKRYHDMMKERLNKLDDVLHEILDYSRNNKSEIVIKPVNLLKIVNKSLSDLRYAEGIDQITVDVSVAEDLVINTDISRLTIIINNLISNAIKYSDRSKEISFVKIQARVRDEAIEISIEDNGEGISPQYHDKIFSMFYRASNKSAGSGLGLYLVKEATEKLEGKLQLKSERGIGSTFTVILPRS
ncbi:MAG TPA: HAMP domain-containing sensor histidine kinase [Cyclobacteriaceae bacterium]